MKKIILSIVGARPQFIKLFPISEEIRKHYEEKIIHTGQHFDKEMSDTFFRELGIPEPDVNLNINRGNHGNQTGRMLIELEKYMLDIKPDLVIVFGDTNTTLSGTLAAAKLHIPVVHVESGLRSFNKLMPEEINRVLTDHAADYLFAPTKSAMNNLEKEGLNERSFYTGDVMVDVSLTILEKAKNESTIEQKLQIEAPYHLMTLHRPYNVDEPERLKLILQKISKVKQTIIFPAHPRTRQVIEKHDIHISENIQLIKPLGYLDFTKLLANAEKVITDSGGIQKEAYIHKRPCLTVRPETEWVETLEDGWNKLIQPGNEDFVDTIRNFQPTSPQSEIFGKDVAENILKVIREQILE